MMLFHCVATCSESTKQEKLYVVPTETKRETESKRWRHSTFCTDRDREGKRHTDGQTERQRAIDMAANERAKKQTCR